MTTYSRKWIEFLKQCLLLNSAATVIAITFNVVTFGRRSFSLEEVLSSFVYSNCIGTLILSIIFFLSPRWNKNLTIVRLAKVFVSIFIMTLVGVILARFILSIIHPEYARQNLIPGWRNFVFSLGIAFTFGFGSYFYEISQTKLRQKELDEEKAKTLMTEAQLASLESKIHPHFLFNTLNSIAALINEDPTLAEKTVEKLSALLRYSLDSNTGGLVSFEKELEITRKYLEIEKVRFEDRLNYKLETEGNPESVKVPPFALQTLVENSIKHVASKSSKKTEISISAFPNGVKFIIEVRDNGPGFSAGELKEGHGLDNLNKRLKNIFAEQAELEIVHNGAGGKVRLKIPKSND